MRALSTVLTLLTFTTACASATRGTERAIPVTHRAAISTSRVIDRNQGVALDELRSAQQADLLGALTIVRPGFLMPTRATDLYRHETTIEVFVDGIRVGGAEELRGFPVERVASVRFVRRSQGYLLHAYHIRGDAALFITTLR